MKFACRKISLEEILKCSFNFNKTEFKVFKAVVKKNEPISVNELSKIVNLTKSSVQKAIKKLIEKEIVERKQVNKKRGGFYYKYYLKNKEVFKQKLINKINNWSSSIKKEIERL